MRLQLTRRADYAVRAVLALAEAERLLPAAELARRMAMPPNFLPQIMSALVAKGILRRTLGRHGGYVLARPAAEISLLQVLDAAEASPRRRSCVLRSTGCQPDQPCAVHPAVAGAEDALRAVLAGADFASLVDRRSTHPAALPVPHPALTRSGVLPVAGERLA